jgi:Bacterial SH3 domain
MAVVLLSSCALQQELTRQTEANRGLEEKLARLQLQLLEEESRNRELNRKLDEATLEVVRAKAKLHSLESKAEAASTLAEGEIALKALRISDVGLENDPEVLHAEALLKASNLEIKKQNYGGALYLATRAKVIIKESQERTQARERTPKMEGEVPFAIPLPLRLVAQSNVREGPGLDSKILFSLRKGSPLVGTSYRGLWVRVRTEDGQGGWVYYSLVDGE